MAQTVCVLVNAEEAARLEAIVAGRNRPLKHVRRARIILASVERLPVLEVAQRTGASRPAVWRWQARYAEEGVDGLLRDKTRPPGMAPLTTAKVAKVLALTCSEPPGEVTHWAGDGQGNGGVAERHPAHLGGSSPPASQAADLQALHRSRLRRQSGRRRRPLHATARPRPGAVNRREDPDPGAGPRPAGPAAQARQTRDHDP